MHLIGTFFICLMPLPWRLMLGCWKPPRFRLENSWMRHFCILPEKKPYLTESQVNTMGLDM
ncbi:hypothetical protein H261_22813 [Paramagnetospirillum caucaseum]|uniref:Uncharacterized protein n=1 Tax=Paramagnetospirillum caucaseum TaxID=1244869 RepID=M2ZJU0_9PROT|nr:hypothetical protein H261_22813 [Paramagnetospirillum caucaseum]